MLPQGLVSTAERENFGREGSPMIYRLQDLHNDHHAFERLGELAEESKSLFADRLTLDMSQVRFLAANLASALGAILARIADNLNTIEILNLNEDVLRILQRNRFLAAYGYKVCPDYHRTTMRFSRLHLADAGEFEAYILQQFEGKNLPEMSDAAMRVFRKKVFEVFQNSILHSQSKTGVFVCGQYFLKENQLYFTITDVGIGIRDSVRNFFKNRRIGSIPALRWALQPHNTTKSNNGPGGLGLAELQKFARLNRGRIQIASRSAFYELNRDGDEIFTAMAVDFPGTAVTIQVNTADQARYVLKSELQSDGAS